MEKGYTLESVSVSRNWKQVAESKVQKSIVSCPAGLRPAGSRGLLWRPWVAGWGGDRARESDTGVWPRGLPWKRENTTEGSSHETGYPHTERRPNS